MLLYDTVVWSSIYAWQQQYVIYEMLLKSVCVCVCVCVCVSSDVDQGIYNQGISLQEFVIAGADGSIQVVTYDRNNTFHDGSNVSNETRTLTSLGGQYTHTQTQFLKYKKLA